MIFGVLAKPRLKNFRKVKLALIKFLGKKRSTLLVDESLEKYSSPKTSYASKNQVIKNSDVFLARIRAVHTLARRVEGSRRSDRFTRRSNQQNNSQRRWWMVPALEGDDGPKGGAYIKFY